MKDTIAQSLAATPRERLADVRPQPMKASLQPQVPATPMRTVAADAIHVTSSQKAAASDIGINEGRLSHKLKDGSLTLAQLESLGPKFAARFGEELVERYAPLATPQARAKQKVREARAALDEIDQALEHIA